MGRRVARSVAIVAVFLSLTGCNQARLMKRLASPEDEAAARQFIDLLRQKKFDEADSELFSGLQDSDTHETLVNVAAMFPEQEPKSTKVVGFHEVRNGNWSTRDITVEYEFPEKWLLANVVIQERDGVDSIAGFHVTPIPNSLEDLNRFTLSGKSFLQYTVLLLALASSLFSLYAFVLCIKTRMEKRKWLWLILTFFGVARFGVEWTSGKTFYNYFWFNLPPAGAMAALYGPWMVYFSLPLGAILFLSLRKRLAASIRKPAPQPLVSGQTDVSST